jgi:hypothetical protein
MRPRILLLGLHLVATLGLVAPPAGAEAPPAIVALTLDTSGSIKPEVLAQTRDLAIALLQNLPPGSQVSIFTFDDQSRLILEHTADQDAIRQALESVTRAGRYTALYDALYDASRHLKEAPPARKAIVLVTDGVDENSSLQVEDGLKIAVDNRIPVLAVGIGRVQEAVLRRIAKLTSGEFVAMANASPEALAARIRDLPAPTPEPTAPPTAPAAAAAPAEAPSDIPFWVWLLLVVAVWAFGLAWLRSRGTAPAAAAPPKPAGPEPDKAHEPGPPKPEGEGADSTVVMKNPALGFVEKTVMLKFEPALMVTKGDRTGHVFPLPKESAVSIGRAPTNDIAIKDTSISSEHCRIRPEGGVFVVHDLESTNGTFVNEKRITRHELAEGDVVRVGETHLRFSTRGGI